MFAWLQLCVFFKCFIVVVILVNSFLNGFSLDKWFNYVHNGELRLRLKSIKRTIGTRKEDQGSVKLIIYELIKDLT